MTGPRLGRTEILFAILIGLTVAARLLDAWPASSRDIESARALAASNAVARSFLSTCLSADDGPSRGTLRQWRSKVLAIEAGASQSREKAPVQPMRGTR